MLEGKIRDSITKSNAKTLKRNGYLIANIYGKGEENIHCAFKRNEFIKYMRAKTNLVFPVKLGDKSYEVVVQEYQKDPVTNDILHVDMIFVKKGTIAKFKIPVKVKGIAVGLKNKGVLVFSRKRIAVKCKPEDLPNSYMLDVTNLDVGHTILVRDLPIIDGVQIIDKPNLAVVGIIKAK
ncbi:50S ribosomal protein L25/general stress protein Ctc [Helicobacter muridarum]|uniref:Large ribosomal subunit protein bL25 n=1 Tax=Helicobacter muridarum TaxID=216 RepID=A0A099U0F3_9HELI|nr:50S ribosomal protein L25/general stress protein Ctc [Helicobacter muridarum]TLE00243.1 50S ribosomal protein L25/general stress protein Ctc [Helicobacter muridarum]STQ85735.1 50S ribosomal protein L25 [Helicobacter muridarum]